MRLHLPKPPNFNFKQIVWFLDRGYDDCLHKVEGNSVWKPIKTGNRKNLIRIEENHSDLVIHVNGPTDQRNDILNYVNTWFDLDRDLSGFYAILRKSGSLESLPDSFYGFRIIAIPDLFESLAWSIIGQQINLRFAYRIKRAFVESYGEPADDDLGIYHFPGFEVVRDLSVTELRELQFSSRKAEYLIGIARSFSNGSIAQERLADMTDTAEVIDELCKTRGIGEWTANYAVMKSLGRMDCIPWGDTGMLEAIRKMRGLDRKPTREEVQAFYKPFKGWESYLTFYLWRSLY